MVVHARGNWSKGPLKERIISVQLEANSGESILKIFLKRMLNLSQDHLSIRVACSSNTQKNGCDLFYQHRAKISSWLCCFQLGQRYFSS